MPTFFLYFTCPLFLEYQTLCQINVADLFLFCYERDFGCVVVDFLFIVTPIVGVCNCSMFFCTLLYVHSSIAIILMGKRELVALLNLSSWCLVMVERLFLVVPWGCLWFVIVVIPDHTHLLFFMLSLSGNNQTNIIEVLTPPPDIMLISLFWSDISN